MLQRLKAVTIAAATSVEKHVAPSDLVIEIPFVLSTQNVKLCGNFISCGFLSFSMF